MIPPQLAIFAAKYGSKAIMISVLILSLIAGYYYWKHEVASEAYEEAIVKCNESKERFRIDAEHFNLAKQEEVDKLSKEQDERLKNAIEIYVKHYELNRNTAIATSLRIKTNSASSSCDTMPGADQSRSKIKAGTERSGEAELSSGALRQFNKVIDDIEGMGLRCEKLLNSVP